MVVFDSYYELLDVDPDASIHNIKAAYREKAKQHHPDVSNDPNAEEIFKALTAAKETLTDTTERAQYDRLGHDTYTSNDQSTATPSYPQKEPDRNPASTYSQHTKPGERRTTTTANGHSTQRQRHHRRRPEPDEWVGSPGWSNPPNETPGTNRNKTYPYTTSDNTENGHNGLSYVIPPKHFEQTLILTILLYGLSIYGFFSPFSDPVHMLVATFTLPLTFLLLVSTRLGFYIFPLFAIATPVLLLGLSPLEGTSVRLLGASLLPILGFIITLLVSTIRPS